MRHAKNKQSPITRLVTPSIFGGSALVICALGFTGLLIIIFMTNAGTLQQHLISWHHETPAQTLTLPGQELPQNDNPTLLGSWPLIVLWSVVGLLVYAVASYVVHTVIRAAHFKENYEHVAGLSHEAMESLVHQLELRMTALLLFAGISYLFATRVVPYSILLTRASAADFFSISGIGFALISTVSLLGSLHVLVVFLRLALGRMRLLD